MAPRLGFTEGQDNMQMVLAPLDVARGNQKSSRTK
jgi:hypothetical protein